MLVADLRVTLLHAAVAAVAPIDGVWADDWADRTTWGCWFQDSATDVQKAAAQNAINTFDPSFIPVPDITKAQALLWLWSALQKTEQDVLNAIATITDPSAHQSALIEWQYKQPFQRSHPLFDQLGAILGLTPAQLDDAFRAAALL